MLASLASIFTSMAHDSSVLPPSDQQRVAHALENDAELMSNTQLAAVVADEPPTVQEEIVRINTEARPRALQVALIVPLLAALVGAVTALRMRRHPEADTHAPAEGLALG